MTIYVSTACLPGRESLESRLNRLSTAGLKSIELGAGVDVGPKDLDLLSRLKSQGCHFLVHNYFPPPPEPFVLNLASADHRILKQSQDLVRKALTWSAELGASLYSVHGGFVTDPVGYSGGTFEFPFPKNGRAVEAAKERFTESIVPLLKEARALGLALLVENNVCLPRHKGKLLLQTAEEFAELIALVQEPDLGVLLDTGHLQVTARTYGFDPAYFIDELTEWVGAIHLHTNDGLADIHQPVDAQSWLTEKIRQTTLVDVPVVIEAKFDEPAALADYVGLLQRQLTAI